MTGQWKIIDGKMCIVFNREDVEADIRRALAWQEEFDRKKAVLATRYRTLSRWRQFLYRWFGVGLGYEASGYMKRKVLELV